MTVGAPPRRDWELLEQAVLHAGYELAKQRLERFQTVFGDSLAGDLARLQVARKVRGRLEWATSQQIEAVIEECLTDEPTRHP
jgi:hypothetical protein